jgi:hypothetical protein
MGYLKLTPSDIVLPARVTRSLKAETEDDHLRGADFTLLTRRLARSNGQTRNRLSAAEQVALARIAERFAPGALPSVAPEDQRPDHPAPQDPVVPASSTGMRTLIALLICVALLPSLTFEAMVWLGAIKTPWSTPVGLQNSESEWHSASATSMPVADRSQSKQTANLRPVSLSAPATLEAKAGSNTPFAIALDPTGTLPARSIFAIAGLPRGSTLSAGRPYGETEWNLRSDEIGDLRLVLPKAASGETKLRVRLVAPDGEILAGTETVLKVAVDPEAGLSSPEDKGPDTGDFSDFQALVPGLIYDPSFVRIGAWDDETQQRLATTGVEERLTDLEAPVSPPDHLLQVQPPSPAQATNHDLHGKWIKPSAFVNLREGPTASAEVISIVAKGTKLSVMGRKRGWLKVTNPATSESGWIYAGNVVTSTKAGRAPRRGSQPEAASGSESFWPSLSGWLTSP